jgi:hypothetical protein
VATSVNQRQFLAGPGLRAAEGVADHPLDAVGSVQADLGGHLVRGAGTHRATVADVRALGALADDHEVDVLLAQRRDHARIELGRAQVHVVVEGETQLEQQAAFQHARGHAGVADGAEQDRVVPA